VTPEVVLDEPVPAAPLPKTGGLDPSFLYGLGALLAGSGLVIKRKKK
jgi:LPXTG-motif cell wall-anchored protein